MIRKHLIGVVITQLIVSVLAAQCNALETITHEQINEYIARSTLDSFSLDRYLKQLLGMPKGIESPIQGVLDDKSRSDEAWGWLAQGGLREDKPYWYMPYLRSANHFHNPLTDQGFSGIWGKGFISGDSSIVWSQKPRGAQGHGGNYSWSDVRGYFYNALTAADEATRQRNFADAFRGV